MKLFVVLLAGLCATAQRVPALPEVAVITVPDVEAYARTIAGIREQIPNIVVWDARDEAPLREYLAKGQTALAIAVGSSASAALQRLAPPQLVLINSLVLESDLERNTGRSSRFKTAVTIDLPPEVLLTELARLFPGRTRIGLIRGPAQTDAHVKAFEQAARRKGLTVEVMPCLHPRDLVEAFLKLKSLADLVWCPSDAQLYNSATLKPLLIASLTNRLPIIGFSEQFVQAGALFGGSADYVDVGRQVAALALRIVRNEPVATRHEARKFLFAYNQRVARMLGVKAVIPDNPGKELNIIR